MREEFFFLEQAWKKGENNSFLCTLITDMEGDLTLIYLGVHQSRKDPSERKRKRVVEVEVSKRTEFIWMLSLILIPPPIFSLQILYIRPESSLNKRVFEQFFEEID